MNHAQRWSIRRWSAAALAVPLLVVGGAVASGIPPANAAARSTSTTVAGTALDSNAIACPTATMCLAGGTNDSGDAVIVTINGSNGAAAIAGSDSAAESPFAGIACPTATDCVAVSGVGDSASVNGSNGKLGANHHDSGSGIYYAVDCPNATHCYAGGTELTAGPTFTTALTELTPKAIPNATTEGQSGAITGLACVSASRCYASVANGAGGDIVVINNGKFGKSFPTPFDGEAITCFGAASSAVVGAIGETIYTATVNPTTGNPGPAKLIKKMTSVSGVTCATATECFAVGYLVSNSTLSARVSDIANGAPTAAKALTGQSLAGVACSTPTTCWAVGEDSTGTGIVDAVPVP